MTAIVPLTHGNAWSIYFEIPSSTASRCSSTRPGTCPAPSEAARPDKSNDEIVATTQPAFDTSQSSAISLRSTTAAVNTSLSVPTPPLDDRGPSGFIRAAESAHSAAGSAVHGDDLTGDVVGQWRAQPEDRVGGIADRAGTAERDECGGIGLAA